MRRLAMMGALVVGLLGQTGCLDFDKAEKDYCAQAAMQGRDAGCAAVDGGTTPGVDGGSDGGSVPSGDGGSDGGTTPGTDGGAVLQPEQAGPGAIIWGQRLGGVNDEVGAGVAVTRTDRIWVAGSFEGTPSFGSTMLRSRGGSDVLLLGMDMNGTLRNAIGFGGTGQDRATAIISDYGFANVVVAGTFEQSITVGSTTLTATGHQESFVARFSDEGVFQAVARLGTDQPGGRVQINAVASQGDEVVVVGEYEQGKLIFEGFGAGPREVPIVPGTSRAMFVLSLSYELTQLQHAATTTGCGFSTADDVSYSYFSTSVAVTGRFDPTSPCMFGAAPAPLGTNPSVFVSEYEIDTLDSTPAHGAGMTDYHLWLVQPTTAAGPPARIAANSDGLGIVSASRLTTAGAPQAITLSQQLMVGTRWSPPTRDITGMPSAAGTSVALDDAENIWWAGSFTDNLAPAAGPGLSLSAATPRVPNAFLAGYTQAGGTRWSRAMGATRGATARSVAVHPFDTRMVVLLGDFIGQLQLGGLQSGHQAPQQPPVDSNGGSDLFLLRFHPIIP